MIIKLENQHSHNKNSQNVHGRNYLGTFWFTDQMIISIFIGKFPTNLTVRYCLVAETRA